MNGAILGMKQVEIKRKFDEIVDFSGIEKFIDTPVKHYSSGMYVRLAFAVAAHLEPEILIIDEVLAVGDAEFQKKCLGKMNDVSSKEGRTILFVSHAMSAVKQLCRKAFLLSKGQIEKLGSSEEVAAYYLSGSVEKASSQTWSDIQTAPGNEVVKLLSVSALSALNQPYIDIDSGIIFEFRFHNFLTGKNIDFTIEVVNSDGVLMFHNGIILSQNQDSEIGVYEVTLSIPPNLLNAGRYFVHVFWGENCSYLIHRIDEVIAFDIENTIPKNAEHKIQGLPGVIRPQLKWEKKFLSKEVLI
jgi:lipopolysaccharide transport system ATP-binding protein